jgi:hypothetical protein
MNQGTKWLLLMEKKNRSKKSRASVQWAQKVWRVGVKTTFINRIIFQAPDVLESSGFLLLYRSWIEEQFKVLKLQNVV